MTKFNEKTSNKKQKPSAILSQETQSLRIEHIFCLDLISKEIQVLAGKFTLFQRRKTFQLRDINKNVKCTNLGIYTVKQGNFDRSGSFVKLATVPIQEHVFDASALMEINDVCSGLHIYMYLRPCLHCSNLKTSYKLGISWKN